MPAKRRGSKAMKTTTDPPITTIQRDFIKSVQTTFAKQHFEQLKLDYGANCFDPFNKIFMENVNVNEIDIRTRNDASVLLKEQRFDIWLHFMSKLVSANRFPGSTLIQSTLELLLSMNQKYHETTEKTSIRIQSICLLFENIVDNFPPAWSFCFNAYKKLLYSPVVMEIDFRKIRMSSTDGLFPVILALLDDAIRDIDNNCENGSDNGFDSMMNFQQFEKIESAKCCYTKLTRTERIERLFIVLNLFTKLLELDLSIWIQRYPFQTRDCMGNATTCPLIGHLLWKGKNCGEVNVMMRDILKLFTMSIWIGFPDEKTDTLARLVNLMTVAVSLSEKCVSDNLIAYPNIKRLTETFAAEMVKSIETYPYTVDFYINVIAKIRSPAIRMHLSGRILGKFTRDYENVSLRKIVDGITKENFLQYDERQDDTTMVRHQRSSETYPTYDPKKDGKTSKHLKIHRDEFLTLLLNLFESYVEVYRTHDLLQSLLSPDAVTVTSNSMTAEQYKKLHDKVEFDRNHRHNFDLLTKDWEHVKVVTKNTESSDKIPVAPLTECRNVHLEAAEFVRCQEDLEYLVKLEEIVEESGQLGDTFKKWREAVSKYLPN